MYGQNIGAMYDAYLDRKIEEMNSFCEGEPKIIDSYQEFEGYDEAGNMETSTSYTYNCEECEEKDCEYWKDFHEEEWAELQAEQEEENE